MFDAKTGEVTCGKSKVLFALAVPFKTAIHVLYSKIHTLRMCTISASHHMENKMA
jgi:hypothetical protein